MATAVCVGCGAPITVRRGRPPRRCEACNAAILERAAEARAHPYTERGCVVCKRVMPFSTPSSVRPNRLTCGPTCRKALSRCMAVQRAKWQP